MLPCVCSEALYPSGGSSHVVRFRWRRRHSISQAVAPAFSLVEQDLKDLVRPKPLGDATAKAFFAVRDTPQRAADLTRQSPNRRLCFGLGNGPPLIMTAGQQARGIRATGWIVIHLSHDRRGSRIIAIADQIADGRRRRSILME